VPIAGADTRAQFTRRSADLARGHTCTARAFPPDERVTMSPVGPSRDRTPAQLAATIDAAAAGVPPPQSTSSLPAALANWDRYEVAELLGRGGMGVVYKARDRRLDRTVALKFIHMHNVSLETAQRLMREARAQARISHSGVCRVHEVGEVEGQLYIAMEYQPGKSLQHAHSEMTLEEKLHVIKDVAVALHAAHQLGIIHRDIKPANIMAMRRDDGSWHAVVMDFGLARDSTASDKLTQTGAVMGTPGYMSPEQARGEASRLDRRSDVYSLGAMLYELLSGVPPFDGPTIVQILIQVMHDDPKPLRQRNATLPVDLETIAQKCLNKEAHHRYPSAQALADDLDRYLRGEPILARQVSWHYRLRQVARKHKLLVALAVVTVLAILAVLGTAVRAQAIAARQAKEAQRIGQEIKEIEMFLRFAYALPLHDTRIEKKVIRERMESIRERLDRRDGMAAATAHYGLGRGHLALQELDRALEHLQLAYSGGLKSVEVEYALGRTLGEIYNRHFKEVQRRSGRLVPLEKQKIDKKYLEPALLHLRQASGLRGESRPFAEGLLAYYSQQYEVALTKAQEAITQEPWIYEAKKLQGDVFCAFGLGKQKRGLYEEARSDYRRAAELYHDAAEMARSDSSIHSAEADMWVQVMDVDKTQGLSPKEAFSRALSACESAIVTNPDNDSAVRKKLWAFIRWAEYQSSHGEDPRKIARMAIETARQASRLNPKNAFPYDQMGNAYLLIARAEHEQGLDTSDSEKRAAEAFQKSIDVNPMFAWAWNDFAVLHSIKADWMARRGADYRDELSHSISKLQRAIEADPDYHIAYSNLVDDYQLLARFEIDHGRSPEQWVEKAIETTTRSLQVNPNFYETYRNLAAIYAISAQHEAAHGRSPQQALGKALEHLALATKANPNDAETRRELAHANLLYARDLFENGKDPEQPLTDGLQAIERSIVINPTIYESYILQSQLLLLRAQQSARRNQSPLALLTQAQAVASRARDLSPKNPEAYLRLGEIAKTRAEWQQARRQPVAADVMSGLLALDHALGLNPALAQALGVRGALQVITARAAVGAARKRAAHLATIALHEALEKNPRLERHLGPLLRDATAMSQ
jgi:tRNA A-37 threonylcarbamoyl transferase component Bud32